MLTCFVIQPFDKGKFDKRYKDIYEPAITAAGLLPYRVDRDPSVDIAIESIEENIRSAAACLADITIDNPNVWYELGYAFSQGRPVVMVSEERQKFPFDIQHRAVIPYKAESSSDFEELRETITERLKVRVSKNEAIRQMAQVEQIAPVSGLRQPELVVLASIAGSVLSMNAGVSLWTLKNEAEKAGLTAVGYALGLRRLQSKGFVEMFDDKDHEGNVFDAVRMLNAGWEWIDKNEDKFLLRKGKKERDDFDDDIPF